MIETDSPTAIRERIRMGLHIGHTVGLAPEFAQGNLAIVPRDAAEDFLRFAQLNPRACPLLAVGEPGKRSIPSLGVTDICREFPAYNVYVNGELSDEVKDITSYWCDDMVTFVIGCSYSFEGELIRYGIPLRHMEEDHEVPMYLTNIPNKRSGAFGGNMVVSMRPMKAADAIRAIQITTRFPQVHGAPVHIGDPALIGIQDLDKPEYGFPSTIQAGEIPVYWACGVTPQQAIRSAKLPLAIAHKPGHMLITNIRNSQLSIL